MLRSEWEIEKNVTCAVCPQCAFTFDAIHIDTDGPTYSCPMCGAVGDVPAEILALQHQFDGSEEG